MNHSNLRITIDPKNNHPYALDRRLQFFAHKATVKLVSLLSRGNLSYAIIKT
jgi:hypothetical protein